MAQEKIRSCRRCGDDFDGSGRGGPKYCRQDKIRFCEICGAEASYVCSAIPPPKMCGKKECRSQSALSRPHLSSVEQTKYSAKRNPHLTVANHPLLSLRWHPTKNSTLEPSELTIGSNHEVWWICAFGHEDFCSPKSWLYRDCRVCSNRVLLLGYNDLFSHSPHLLDDWDFELNSIDPHTIRFNYRDKVHWKCSKCGHRWEAWPKGRAAGSGCSPCSNDSFLEQTVLAFLKENYSGPILRQNKLLIHEGRKYELDFFLPEIGVAIEVQDFATHSKESDNEESTYRKSSIGVTKKKGPTYHSLKRDLVQDQLGVSLIELWEDEVKSGDFVEKLSKSLATGIQIVLPERLKERLARLESAYKHIDKSESNVSYQEFLISKQNTLFPWVCSNGHQYIMSRRDFLRKKTPCLECSSKS